MEVEGLRKEFSVMEKFPTNSEKDQYDSLRENFLDSSISSKSAEAALTPEKIEYTAMFVNNPEKLLRMFPAKHPKIFAHHSTNWYKPNSIEELEIGKKNLLKIIGQAYDEKCFAVLVENVKSKNKFPHITISCAKDIAPVYSNELLERASKNGSLEIFQEFFFIEVTEGYKNLENKIILSKN